jgi:hypothetical protein
MYISLLIWMFFNENFSKIIILVFKKIHFKAITFFTIGRNMRRGREREREKDFFDQFICANIANQYDCDVLGSLHNCKKILELQDL